MFAVLCCVVWYLSTFDSLAQAICALIPRVALSILCEYNCWQRGEHNALIGIRCCPKILSFPQKRETFPRNLVPNEIRGGDGTRKLAGPYSAIFKIFQSLERWKLTCFPTHIDMHHNSPRTCQATTPAHLHRPFFFSHTRVSNALEMAGLPFSSRICTILTYDNTATSFSLPSS